MSKIDANYTDGLAESDSGGPGTYSQLLIVKEYMNRIVVDTGVDEDDIYPADYYDLMGGVGFGGCVWNFSLSSLDSDRIRRLAAIMLGHLRMNVNQAIDALLTIASTIFPGEPKEQHGLKLNAQNLKEAVENMLLVAEVPLDTKMNDQRRPCGNCKVYVLKPATITL